MHDSNKNAKYWQKFKKENTVEKYVVQYKCKVIKLNRPRDWSHIGAESNATIIYLYDLSCFWVTTSSCIKPEQYSHRTRGEVRGKTG